MGLGADWRDRAAAPRHGLPRHRVGSAPSLQLALDAATPGGAADRRAGLPVVGRRTSLRAPAPTAHAVRDGSGPASDSSSACGEPLMRAWIWRWSRYRWPSRERRQPSRRAYGTGSPVPSRRFARRSAWLSPSMAQPTTPSARSSQTRSNKTPDRPPTSAAAAPPAVLMSPGSTWAHRIQPGAWRHPARRAPAGRRRPRERCVQLRLQPPAQLDGLRREPNRPPR